MSKRVANTKETTSRSGKSYRRYLQKRAANRPKVVTHSQEFVKGKPVKPPGFFKRQVTKVKNLLRRHQGR